MEHNRVRWLTDSLSKLVGRLSFGRRFSAARPVRHVASQTVFWSPHGKAIEEATATVCEAGRAANPQRPARLFDARLRMRIMQAFRQHEHNVACRGGDFYFFGMLAEVETSWRANRGAAPRGFRPGTPRFADAAIDRFFVCPDYEMLEFLETCFVTRAMRLNSAAAEAAQTINRVLEEATIGAALRELDRQAVSAHDRV